MPILIFEDKERGIDRHAMRELFKESLMQIYYLTGKIMKMPGIIRRLCNWVAV